MEQKEVNEIMAGMDEAIKAEEDRLSSIAPRCHNRPMVLQDWNDGDNWESWWECSYCGHTKAN